MLSLFEKTNFLDKYLLKLTGQSYKIGKQDYRLKIAAIELETLKHGEVVKTDNDRLKWFLRSIPDGKQSYEIIYLTKEDFKKDLMKIAHGRKLDKGLTVDKYIGPYFGQCCGKSNVELLSKYKDQFPVLYDLYRYFSGHVVYRWSNMNDIYKSMFRCTTDYIESTILANFVHERAHHFQDIKAKDIKILEINDAYHYQWHEYQANKAAYDALVKWFKKKYPGKDVPTGDGLNLKEIAVKIFTGMGIGTAIGLLLNLIGDYSSQTEWLISLISPLAGSVLFPTLMYKRHITNY